MAEAKDVTGNLSLDDDKLIELQSQLDRYKSQAIGYHEGEIGALARIAYDYYHKKLPEPVTRGASKAIMPVVNNCVNGTLQELTSVFTSGEKVVQFTPTHPEDAFAALACTEMVNQIMLQENQGWNVLSDAFKESLIVRNSFVKTYWDKNKKEIETLSFEDMTKEELDKFLATLDGDIIEMSTEVMKATKVPEEDDLAEDEEDTEAPAPNEERFKGYVIQEIKKEGVVIEYVPFEDVILDPTARSMEDLAYIAHRVKKTKNDLLELGFNPEVVEALNAASSDIDQGIIANARVNYLNPLSTTDVIDAGDKKADALWLFEHYIRTSLPAGRVETLQVFTVNNQILEINRINSQPFTTFTPFPMPGSIWGESIYDAVKDLQDIGSAMIRGVIDNTMQANFRNFIGLEGGYEASTLQNRRPNSVIVEKSMNALRPMDYHPLPQGTDTIFQYVEAQKEERTGVSKASQGLDPSIFRNDNSTATVQMVMSAAQQRIRMVARSFAQHGIIPLMLRIYDLIRMNATKPIVVQTAKGPATIFPRDLPRRDQMQVAVAVGAGERGERAQRLGALFTAIATPGSPLAQFVQPQNAYYIAQQLFACGGFFDTENFLTSPDKVPAPQPDPAAQAQQAVWEKQAENFATQSQKIIADINNSAQELQFKMEQAADEVSLKKAQVASQADISADQHQIELLRLENEKEKLRLESRKLDLKEQELLLQAQMEAQQQRPVSLR